MKLMFISFFTICSILAIMALIIVVISKKVMTDMQKATPFECGFNPMSYTRLPFSIHFFLIAVIFLIFDIEIIMILPMIMTMKTSMMIYWLTTSVAFLTILMIGLVHEWNNGMISWTQ